MQNIVINGIYRHYKGNLYQVINIAKHTENLENLVIYKDINDDSKIWARPVNMWNDDVNVNNKIVKRFTYIK